jgi:hypothetical protein
MGGKTVPYGADLPFPGEKMFIFLQKALAKPEK